MQRVQVDHDHISTLAYLKASNVIVEAHRSSSIDRRHSQDTICRQHLGTMQRLLQQSRGPHLSKHVQTVIACSSIRTDSDRDTFIEHLLDRRKSGRAFIYIPAVSREQLETGIREDVIEGLLDGTERIQPVLACIVDAVSEKDRELLDELDRLVQEKKRQLTTE